jgi:hypothetical protein
MVTPTPRRKSEGIIEDYDRDRISPKSAPISRAYTVKLAGARALLAGAYRSSYK